MKPKPWSVNGAGKFLGWVIPIGAVVYFLGSFLFNMGQVLQQNTDMIKRMNQRICVLEEALKPRVIDADCRNK